MKKAYRNYGTQKYEVVPGLWEFQKRGQKRTQSLFKAKTPVKYRKLHSAECENNHSP